MNESSKNKTIEFLRMGMGLEIDGDKLSHRFRTAFKNNDSECFFIEVGISDINCDMPAYKDTFNIGDLAFRVDHLFRQQYIKTNVDPCFAQTERGYIGIANKANILNFINNTCNCNFSNLVISDDLVIDYSNNTVRRVNDG